MKVKPPFRFDSFGNLLAYRFSFTPNREGKRPFYKNVYVYLSRWKEVRK
jgi:hypothetical protein